MRQHMPIPFFNLQCYYLKSSLGLAQLIGFGVKGVAFNFENKNNIFMRMILNFMLVLV